MAQTITTINTGIFSLNGVEYSRIYLPLAIGANNIGIYQVYDTRLQLLGATHYSEFLVDGAGAPASQAAAMALLNPVLFSNTAVAASGSSGVVAHVLTAVDIVSNGASQLNIAGMNMPADTLESAGDAIKVVYSGRIDRASGAPTLQLNGFGSAIINGAVSGFTGSNFEWVLEADILRINATDVQFTAKWMLGAGTVIKIDQGTITGINFATTNVFNLTYVGVSGDDLSVRMAFVAKY